jgi:phosphoglycolate phosphatase
VRLFLFDVDGTLLTARGAGRAAFKRALERTYGTAGTLDAYDLRGKTDPRIVRDVLTAAGIPAEAIEARLGACFEMYVRELETILGDGSAVQVMPGIRELVPALSTRADAVVGLLTGNIEAGARLKLRPTGLLARFRVGAFGSDHIDRRRLPAIARERAARLVGHDFDFARVTIVGDTPHDVDCARACGAVAVAVATGQYQEDELAACAPDLLFRDFSDVARALADLTNGRRER